MEVTAHRGGEGELTLPQPLCPGCLFVTGTERRRNKGDPAALCARGHQHFPPWDSSAQALRESEGSAQRSGAKPHPLRVGNKGKSHGKKVRKNQLT